ncbi:MAG: STAS domain-containing protein [Krumholzibacteria bacterium]|nr:STAS domain-containing protein [Candidatus Krumholzibacteria bacterium]
MDSATFLWIRFCPPIGGSAEILHARRDGRRLVVQSTAAVPVSPPEDFELAVESAIRAAIAAGSCRCVVDLAHCPWLNSQGIGALIAWYQVVARAGGKLVLARPNERVRNVLAVTRLDQVFTIHDGFERALDDLLPAA